jgi:hypothetical protein
MPKNNTDRFRKLDVRWLQRHGCLDESGDVYFHDRRIGPAAVTIDVHQGYLALRYRVQLPGEQQGRDFQSLVPLDWVACNYGGRRPWFICPNPECRRRVAILYGNVVFACRNCHRLAYQCQKETDDDRALRRANSIRRRLGWQTGSLNPPGWNVDPAWTWYKPKGMHRATYSHLLNAHNAYVLRSFAGIGERLGLVRKKLNRASMG